MDQASTQQDFVVGIDAGGTHTRVGCYALDGRLLGSATGRGGAALLALEAAGIAPEGRVLDRLLAADTTFPDGAAR